LNRLSLRLQGLVDQEGFESSMLGALREELGSASIQFWKLPNGGSSSTRLESISEDGAHTELGPRDAILAYVFGKKAPLILDTLPPEVRASSPHLPADARSVCAIPVIRDRELLGILLFSATIENGFDADQVDFLRAVASQVAAVSKSHESWLEARAGAIRLEAVLQEKTTELRRAQDRITDQQSGLKRENQALKSLVESETRGQELVGKSPALLEVVAMADKVAPTTATLLILGESGTGKELIARRVHEKSARASAPYVTVNCAALQESLLESELFGHERGSFTGAVATKIGLCEVADGGTLFLDEIGEMSPGIQTKLLRFLQEGEFYRIGGKKPIQVSVRVISATNRDLADEVRAGRFREDLFYRLNTISMRMPPLRERRDDIPLLAEHFLKSARYGGASKVKRIDPRVVEVFQNYPWPGNVRELQNTIERLKILAEGSEIRLEDVPYAIRAPKQASLTAGFAVGTPLDEVEKGHILRTLAFNQGNKTKTAHALSITIKTLYNKLHRYGAIASDAEDARVQSQ
jgi:two-component system response regulator HydG